MAVAQAEQEPTQFIHDPLVTPATGLLEHLLGPIAFNYQKSWGRAGIEIDFWTALNKINSFRPESTFLLTDKERSESYAQMHGTFVSVPSISELVFDLPTYVSVEQRAALPTPPNPTFLVCFSINCPEGYRVIQNGKDLSLARALVTGVPLPPGARRLAYSFMPVPPDDSLVPYYLRQLNADISSPVTMHEKGFDGITVAIMKESRPEHHVAGGGNVLVLHPRDKTEANVFAEMKEARRRDPYGIELVTQGNATLFSDMLSYGLP